MNFQDAQELLEPEALPYTSGIERLADGVLHVAVMTRMPGVTPRMIEWWFGDYMQTTEHYRRWHPRDHIWMEWADKLPGTHVGAKHLVHERIGGRLQKLRIAFEPSEASLGPDLERKLPGAAAFCARTGLLEHPIDIGRLVHLAIPRPWGCELHSRFWLGMVRSRSRPGFAASAVEKIGNRKWTRQRSAPTGLGRALFVHCLEEMTTLSDFLAELYASEGNS